MTLFNPISESQFLVEFSGYGKFFFTDKSGGDIERSSSDFSNGTGNKIFKLVGPEQVSNVTLKAPYDLKFMAYLEPVIFAYSCGLDNTITITPVSCNGQQLTNEAVTANSANPFSISGVTPIPLGAPYIYTGARMVKYMTPKVDRKSANASMFEIEFVVNSVRRGAPLTATPQSTGARTQTELAGEFFGSSVG